MRKLQLLFLSIIMFTASCGDIFQDDPCVTNNTGDVKLVDAEWPDLGDLTYEIEWVDGTYSEGTFISYNKGIQSVSNNPAGFAYILYAWEVYEPDFTRWIVWGETTFPVNQCQITTVYCDGQYMFQGRISGENIGAGGKVLASDYGNGTVLEIIQQLKIK